MDSVTQVLLGASMAGVAAPTGYRRKALLLGAVLGTLPDLDVVIDYGDAVKNFTYHRGFSHSLFVLSAFAVGLWLVLRRVWKPVREDPKPWFWAIFLALITHPLLDAHTAYGTQLFWPLDVAPTMWATLFIIDPLYTLPLLIGVLAAAIWPLRKRGVRLLRAGVIASTLYIGWSWVAQAIVVRDANARLATKGITDAAIFAVPTPFNTLLWRVVIREGDNLAEGFDSLVLDEDTLDLKPTESDTTALNAASDVWAVKRLRWFANSFVKAEVKDDQLILSDLRMGQEPTYVFSHVAAYQRDGQWVAGPTELLPVNFDDRFALAIWRRIWAP